jgi:hypothetical protein
MLRQTSHSSTTETRYFLSLLAGLGALLALRLAARIDLVLDEAQYWTWSRDLAFGYFSKPPMIAWVIRVASDVCGQSEPCLRAASPVLNTLASFMLYLTGRALYGPAVGFWSAIVFDTLPGLSYSSLLITTDVPLILFWTIALYAWVMLVKRQSMGFAILLGVAIGFGLLAKQAMIHAFLCMACHARRVPRGAPSAERRPLGRGRAPGLCPVRPQRDLERRARLPHRQAYRRQHRLEAPIHSFPAAGRVFRAAVRGLRAHPVRRIAARKLARDPSRVRPGQGPAALLLVTGARAAMRPGADLARPRQLVGDRLSRGIDPPSRRRCSS